MDAFEVIEHVLPSQYVREYPHGTRFSQKDTLKIAIKQYIPKSPRDSTSGRPLTVVGVHGNGFPKECYEPFWADLEMQLRQSGLNLGSIWVADSANQGKSGILNEEILGDDTSWFDHSRDLLLMINHFRELMPRPIIGIAHSMGCVQLIHLSIMHPRLLSALIMLEPVLVDERRSGPNSALLATTRRDLWDSRDKARSAFAKAFQTWDSRVLDRFLEYGLRPVPTAIYNPSNDPKVKPTSVTLTTTKHQEAWSYTLPNFEPKEANLDRLLLPSWDPDLEMPFLTSRPECLITMRNLPHVRPSVFYIFGAKSPLSPPSLQERRVRLTGSGVGGSGGSAEGRVEKKTFGDLGHLLIFEGPKNCAEAAAEWIKRWKKQWVAEEKFWIDYKSKKSDEDMLRASETWVNAVKLPANSLRPRLRKL